MATVVHLGTRALGALILATAWAVAVPAQHAAAQPPPGFPNLDNFTAVSADGYVTTPRPGTGPRISFAAPYTMACDFYGGPGPASQPSQDIKCNGEIPGADDIPFNGAGHPRPGDCVVGGVNFKGPAYELSRTSYAGCEGRPASQPGAKLLGVGQKLTYLNVTCAVGADELVACLDTTSGYHGFVLQHSGSWAF